MIIRRPSANTIAGLRLIPLLLVIMSPMLIVTYLVLTHHGCH